MRRGSIPEAWIYKVAYEARCNLEWLKTGKGPQWRSELDASVAHDNAERRRTELTASLSGIMELQEVENIRVQMPSKDQGFASRLQQALGDRGKLNFAKEVGLTVSELRRCLRGKIPGTSTVVRISRALNVSPRFLLLGEAEPPTVEALPGGQIGLEAAVLDYLSRAPADDREAVQRLLLCLSTGSAKIRRHLIAQLELIVELAGLKSTEPNRG